MKICPLSSLCAILVAASVTSCTQGQIEQVIGNKTQDMISGPCTSGLGLLSAAPEFCIYVTELRVTHDTEADVNLTIANRTNRRVYVKIPSLPSLSDSSGTKWGNIKTTGIGSFVLGGSPLPLDPNINSLITMTFRQKGQVVPADLTFSLTGEVMVFKADSKGEMMLQVAPIATRGFQFSGIRQTQQESPQTSAPIEQYREANLAQVAPQGVATATPKTSASSQSSAPVAVVGGSATPFNADIVGLRLGMTPEEVRQTMQEHDKNFKVKEQRASLRDLPETTFLSEMIGGLDRRLPVGSLDSIGVHFPPPPHKSRAIFIQRFSGFEEGKQPLISAIKEGLIKKYGTPSYINEPGLYEIYLEWAYDRSGARIIDTFREQRCIRFNVSDPQNMANVFFEDRQSKGCGVTVLATMGRNDTGGKGGQLATYLAIYIIDDSAFPAMRAATKSYVDTTVRESAKNVPAPKF